MEYYVAPSFEKYERKCEPFQENGKMYVNVEHPNTHNIRKVRAYTAVEYNKAYGGNKKVAASAIAKDRTSDEYLASLKIARGFKTADITLVSSKDEEWLRKNPSCCYATDVGWYVRSQDEFLMWDDRFPEDLKRSKLSWNDFLEKYWLPNHKE